RSAFYQHLEGRGGAGNDPSGTDLLMEVAADGVTPDVAREEADLTPDVLERDATVLVELDRRARAAAERRAREEESAPAPGEEPLSPTEALRLKAASLLADNRRLVQRVEERKRSGVAVLDARYQAARAAFQKMGVAYDRLEQLIVARYQNFSLRRGEGPEAANVFAATRRALGGAPLGEAGAAAGRAWEEDLAKNDLIWLNEAYRVVNDLLDPKETLLKDLRNTGFGVEKLNTDLLSALERARAEKAGAAAEADEKKVRLSAAYRQYLANVVRARNLGHERAEIQSDLRQFLVVKLAVARKRFNEAADLQDHYAEIYGPPAHVERGAPRLRLPGGAVSAEEFMRAVAAARGQAPAAQREGDPLESALDLLESSGARDVRQAVAAATDAQFAALAAAFLAWDPSRHAADPARDLARRMVSAVLPARAFERAHRMFGQIDQTIGLVRGQDEDNRLAINETKFFVAEILRRNLRPVFGHEIEEALLEIAGENEKALSSAATAYGWFNTSDNLAIRFAALLRWGDVEEARGHPAEALRRWTDAFRVTPADSISNNRYASYRGLLGRLNQKIEAMERAAAGAGVAAPAGSRATEGVDIGDLETLFHAMMEKLPERGQLAEALARAILQKARLLDEQRRRLLARAPVPAREVVAKEEEMRAAYRAAAEVYESIPRLAPEADSREAFLRAGDAYSRAGDMQDTLRMLERFADLGGAMVDHPEMPRALTLLTEAAMGLGQFDKARRAARANIDLNDGRRDGLVSPHAYPCYFYEGECAYRLGDLEGATRSFDENIFQNRRAFIGPETEQWKGALATKGRILYERALRSGEARYAAARAGKSPTDAERREELEHLDGASRCFEEVCERYPLVRAGASAGAGRDVARSAVDETVLAAMMLRAKTHLARAEALSVDGRAEPALLARAIAELAELDALLRTRADLQDERVVAADFRRDVAALRADALYAREKARGAAADFSAPLEAYSDLRRAFPDHPVVLWAMDQMANCHERSGDLAEAERLRKQMARRAEAFPADQRDPQAAYYQWRGALPSARGAAPPGSAQ
ncbi:MAG: hypothetical protein HY719_15000, partial [Planctomycetes bacterium]|nr:hypothetical protein [Planctomycetota bacterium]